MLVELLILSVIFMCAFMPRSKILFGCLLFLMLILMAYATVNADLAVYFGRYSRVNSLSDSLQTDAGFGIIMYLCKYIGLSFEGFKATIFLITSVIIYYSLYKYTAYPCVHLAVYFTLFYFIHSIQIRAFMAEWMCVFASMYLLSENPKTLVFIAIVALGSTLHVAAVFSLFLLIPYHIKNPKYVYGIIAVLTAMFPLLYSFISRLLPANAVDRLDFYTNNIHAGLTFGAILFVALLIGLTITIHYISNRKIKNHNFHNMVRLYRFNITNFIPILLIIFYNNNFYRFSRPIIIVSIIFLIEYFFKLFSSYSKERGATLLLSLFLPAAYILEELITNTWYNQIITNAVLSNIT